MKKLTETMEFINNHVEWRDWYKLLVDEEVLVDTEIEDALNKYGVLGIMALRQIVFTRQQNRVTLQDLEQKENIEQLLQRLFLEPINKPMMACVKDLMKRNGWTLSDIYNAHIKEPNARILRVISHKNRLKGIMVDKDIAMDMALKRLKGDLSWKFEGGTWQGYDRILAVKADQYHYVWLVTIILQDLKDIRIFQYEVENGEIQLFSQTDVKTEHILSAVEKLNA